MNKLACFLALYIFSVNGLSGDFTTVDTQNGKITGQEAKTTELGLPFWQFLGIPYAAPPVGKLRFKPPQPVASWANVRNATYYRSVCTQGGINNMEGSEDCLFVNVFTTVRPGSNQTKLPVLVYIHGGAFVIGSGNLPLTSLDKILDNGVIFVTLNYRLGIYGFLCTKDAASPGNYGLKDQIAALKWINKNIATFGGDPNKVTIFGQSAGAVSVQYLTQSKLTQGLFRGAITDSGSTLNNWAIAEKPRKLAFEIGQRNLILTPCSKTLVNLLRKINYKFLQITSTTQATYFNGLPWAPCIENDVAGAVYTTFNYVQQQSGDFARVPRLTGFNSNEARGAQSLLRIYKNLLLTLKPDTLVPKDMHAVDVDAAASAINNFYFNGKLIKNNETAFTEYSSDYLFVRGIRKSVQLVSNYVPVYLYRFSFTGGVDHANFTPEGAAHTEELFLLSTPQVTDAAKLVQKRMLVMWTNFVKTGNPTPTVDEVLDNTWPMSNATGNGDISYLDIGANLTVGVNPENKAMVFWDNLYNKYGFEPYNTY